MNILHKLAAFKEKSQVVESHKLTELRQQIWRNPILFFAFGFGTGAVRYLPGTFGTLAALPLYFLLMLLPFWVYLPLVALLIAFAVYCSGYVVRLLGVKDYSGIVCDEIVGFLVTMAFVKPTWLTIAAGFVLFRIFDMVKPWPIHLLDKHLPGGWGVVIDDIMAGIYAGLCLYVLNFLL